MRKRVIINTAGIDRHWKKGQDDRDVLLRQMFADSTDPADRELVDRFLAALLAVVKRRRRTKFVGVGVFEWKPWNNRLPTGEFIRTWRLTFKPGRYVTGRYHGRRTGR